MPGSSDSGVFGCEGMTAQTLGFPSVLGWDTFATHSIDSSGNRLKVIGSNANRNSTQVVQRFIGDRPKDPRPGKNVRVLDSLVRAKCSVPVPFQRAHPDPTRRRECDLAPESQHVRHVGVSQSFAEDNVLLTQRMTNCGGTNTSGFSETENRPPLQIEVCQFIGSVEVDASPVFPRTIASKLKEHRVVLSRGVAPRAVHAAPGLSFYRECGV